MELSELKRLAEEYPFVSVHSDDLLALIARCEAAEELLHDCLAGFNLLAGGFPWRREVSGESGMIRRLEDYLSAASPARAVAKDIDAKLRRGETLDDADAASLSHERADNE